MEIPFYWIDSFAERDFAGNPAAVCLPPEPLTAESMQKIAAELALSETAFVHTTTRGLELRWFTPKVEVSLCGHATLAAAHVLWESGRAKPSETLSFATKSGMLSAEKKEDKIFLDFPAIRVQPLAVAPPNLLESLGAPWETIWESTSATDRTLLLEYSSEQVLRSLRPDFRRLQSVPAQGVIVTSRSESLKFDFVSRYFGPNEGIDEDPVTGFAHCHLGPYWQHRLNKNSFEAYQASARGGALSVRVNNDRVILGGRAVTIIKGNIVAASL